MLIYLIIDLFECFSFDFIFLYLRLIMEKPNCLNKFIYI